MAKDGTIETGFIGNDIWIGREGDRYELVPKLRRDIHILRFSLKEAEAAVEMLQKEIARKKKELGKESQT